MDIYKEIEGQAKQNYKDYDINDEDLRHKITGNIINTFVYEQIDKIDNKNIVILNAGSGGVSYYTKGKIINLDIVEENIKEYENHIVSSITCIPLKNNSVDMIICVGSVINYADIILSIKEFYRILKDNGMLILEFERSNSADFLFTKNYGKKQFLHTYIYNNQKHPMIIYSEKYVKSILKANNFKILKKKRFHNLSSLFTKLKVREDISLKFGKLDFIFYPFSYFFSHNIIIKCKKIK